MDYGKPLTFGVFVIPDATAPGRALESAIAAEELGFDLVGVQDLNVGLYPVDETVDVLVELATEHGMDTFMLPEDGEDPRTPLGKFADDVIPRARESVARIRGSR